MGLSHVTLWDFDLTIHDSNMFLDCVQVKSTWIKSIWKFRKRISHIAIIKPVYYFLLQHQFINENQFNIYICIYYIYIRRFEFASPPFFNAGSCIYIYISWVKNLTTSEKPPRGSGPDLRDVLSCWTTGLLETRKDCKGDNGAKRGVFWGFREINGIYRKCLKMFFFGERAIWYRFQKLNRLGFGLYVYYI